MTISLKNLERNLLEEAPKVEVPEWIWVDGYKGTDKDMKCRDYQFELGKQFDMPEGSDIRLCDSGFHFCTKLEDVFKYYDIKDGNRFFKVHALVRKNEKITFTCPPTFPFLPAFSDSKETSKSIVFIEELSTEEIFASCDKEGVKLLTTEEKEHARQFGIEKTLELAKINDLERKGYAHSIAKLIVTDFEAYEKACALADQTDISMDARIIALFSNN